MRSLFLILLTALPALALNSRHTYTTAEELQGFGDFNGDTRLDAIVIERSTGNYRIGLAQPNGSLVWSNSKPTGCPNAESLAVGKINSTSTTFAVTGKSANQIFLIDPSLSYTRPLTLTPPGIGPASIAAVDLNLVGNDPALLDLVVATHWNSPSIPNQRHFLQSLSSGITAVSTSSTATSAMERLTRVQLDTAGPEQFGAVLRNSTDTLRLFNATGAVIPILSSLPSLAPGTDFVHAPFLGSTLSQFVLFVPGNSGIKLSAWNGSALTSAATKSVGIDPVRSVHLTHDGTKFGIAVIYNDGDYANLYTFDASENPVLAGMITPPAGEELNGILATSNGHLSSLSGPPGSPSTTTTPFTRSGGAWTPGSPSTLPGLTTSSTRANVFIYDKEPLVNPDAKLVETLNVPDWTNNFSFALSAGSGPDELRITVETFQDQTTGLDSSTLSTIPGLPAGAGLPQALINQSFPEASVSTASTFLGTVPIQISIDPPPGTYTRSIAPQLRVPDPTGITAHYRTSLSDAWSSYTFGTSITPPGDTLTPFTIWFYAEDSTSGKRSTVQQADYSFAGDPGSLDSDGDGVPDFVEIQKGLDPLAGPDSDDDGLSDLEELLLGSDPSNGSETATYGSNTLELPPSRTMDSDSDGFSDFEEWASGSDPFDNASTPSASSLVEYRNTFDLNVRPLSHSGTIGAAPTSESFRSGHPTFSPTDIRVHDLAANLIGYAPTRNHASGPLQNPYASIPAVPATGRDLFVLASTPPTFDCVQTSSLPGWGRELIGLVPIPTLDAGPVPFTGSPSSLAADWIAAAQAHYASLPREEISAPLDLNDTLIYLLWERIVGLKLEARGIIPSPLPLGLASFRDTLPDESQSASIDELLELQSFDESSTDIFLLQTIESSIREEITNPTGPPTTGLKKLANEIYRISAALNDTDPGLYPSPFETLRTIIRTLPTDSGDIDGLIPFPGTDATPSPTSYATAHTLTSTDLTRADSSLARLLTLLPSRPTQTFLATVTPTTFSSRIPELKDSTTTSVLRLYDSDGNPFTFPQSLDLPVGTTLEILAFTDRSDLPSGTGTALETISATITGFPAGTIGDLNQNAIDDEYENYFFGGPVDPFSDADNDGYINLQEALDATNPMDASSTPDSPPLPNRIPPVTITRSGGQVHFSLTFPSEYGDRIYFLLQSSGSTLSAAFTESTNAATATGLNEYTLSRPAPTATKQFYRFRLGLRP